MAQDNDAPFTTWRLKHTYMGDLHLYFNDNTIPSTPS